ncbi:MAG TPA: putative peptidoglycan glycosyltransferase FtsW [Candidatus Sulfotelmatobacter sp.]|jgi:cell division protein FtsW|nr:putative peptidoglycan glycosyltransferase FtsW [Candidatus Sulfotelmatobacter sp.]
MKTRFHFKKISTGKFDSVLFVLALALMLFGLIMVYDASSVIAFNLFGDKFAYIKSQLIWSIIGFIALFIFYRIDYHKLYNLALPLLVSALILLVLVFIPHIGSGAKGANRWVNFGFVTLQPAEFVKLGLAIYLAAWFSHKEKGRFFSFLLLMAAILFLVMLEPDMGTASIILSESAIVYFLSGGSIIQFFVAAPIIGIIGFFYILFEPYRASRLTSFLNLGSSLSNTSYHVKQILIALGSGGVLGLGIGNSIQKYAYLPENVTDSIFPIIAEELGFIGSIILITVFISLIWRGIFIAGKAKDSFGKLLAGGIIAFIAMQVLVNLGAMTALFPLTGVPLPFISYGGSALVIDLASIGIMLNISKQASK